MLLEAAYTEFVLLKSPANTAWYRLRLRRFIAWLQEAGVTDYTSLTASRVRGYLPTLDDFDTVYRYGHVRAIRSWLRWGEMEGLLPEGLAKRVPLPRREVKVVKTLSDDQLAAMFRAARRSHHPLRDTALLSVLLDTGMRAMEVAGLRLRDVSMTPSEGYLLVHGKGNRQRECGLGATARLAVHRYLHRERRGATDPDAPLFLTQKGPLDRVGVDRILYKLRDDAGLPKGAPVSAHKWRHLSIVKGLLAGDDVYAVSRRAGHSSVTMTERYLMSMTSQQARKLATSVLDGLGKQPGR